MHCLSCYLNDRVSRDPEIMMGRMYAKSIPWTFSNFGSGDECRQRVRVGKGRRRRVFKTAVSEHTLSVVG